MLLIAPSTARPRDLGEAPRLFATFMEVDRARLVPTLLRLSARVRRIAAASEGCLGVSMAADPLHGAYMTLSAWTDQAALGRFAAGDGHRAAADAMLATGGLSLALASWRGDGAPLRSSWAEARRRLDAAPRTAGRGPGAR